MKRCKMLALDISSSNTGWAIFENGTYLMSGAISPKDKTDKMSQMMDLLIEFIHSEKPDICVIEEPIYAHGDIHAFQTLAMICGVVLYHTHCSGADFASFRPSEWRKLVSEKDEHRPRKREELKAWDIQKAKAIFDKDFDNDDEADAVLIGQAYLNLWEKQDVSK